MRYIHDKSDIRDSDADKTIAISTHEKGAEIIAKALNFYFGDTYTRNQTVEMMHQNTANVLQRIADFVEKKEFDSYEIIEYIRELQEGMEAQALVVSIRDECGFDKPIQ